MHHKTRVSQKNVQVHRHVAASVKVYPTWLSLGTSCLSRTQSMSRSLPPPCAPHWGHEGQHSSSSSQSFPSAYWLRIEPRYFPTNLGDNGALIFWPTITAMLLPIQAVPRTGQPGVPECAAAQHPTFVSPNAEGLNHCGGIKLNLSCTTSLPVINRMQSS